MAQRFKVQPPLAWKRKEVVLSPVPGQMPPEWAHIGRLAETGPPKTVLADISREHVLAIVGKRGSGKSFTLGSFIESLCTTQRETPISRLSKERAALLFDTLNIFQWMVAPVTEERGTSEHLRAQAMLLKQWGLPAAELDVDLWVPAGFEGRTATRARPFQIRTWDMEVADWAALLRVDAMQDVMGQLLTQLLEKVKRRGWRRSDGTTVTANPRYLVPDLLDCLADDPDISRDYTRETIRALRQRLSSYEMSDIFSAGGTALTDLLKAGRLSVLLLSGVPDDLRMVIILLTIRQLLAARAQASEVGKSVALGFHDDEAERERADRILRDAPPKTWIFIDEAQNVLPSERETAASAILLRFVREGRNFGLSLGFTTQQPSAIDPRIMAQVDLLIAHTLTVQRDLQNVLSNLKSSAPASIILRGNKLELSDSIRLLATGQAFVSSTDADRGFFMDVRPRTSIHGGFES